MNTKGLYNKYIVTKADGSEIDPDAQYFVLRADTDPHSFPALVAYALSIQDENSVLAYELLSKMTALWGDDPSPPYSSFSEVMEALDTVQLKKRE